MAKPIFTVGLPGIMSRALFAQISSQMEDKFSDYYVLVYPDSDLTSPKFEAFYEKDFNEVKFEELKQMINERLNK